MSDAAAVRFPDGSVRYGVYDPEVEAIWPPLFGSLDEARGEWARREGDPEMGGGGGEGQPAPVEVTIFADFDGGFWWVGEATPAEVTLGITWAGIIGTYEDVEWDDEPRTRHREVPDWAREALGLPGPPGS